MYLEKNLWIQDNLFGFYRDLTYVRLSFSFYRQHISILLWKIFLSAVFISIKGAFDSVHIPTLLSRLTTQYIPYCFCNYISTLSFSRRYLTFSSPSGSIYTRKTFRGFLQSSCMRTTLFNIYMSNIRNSLTFNNIQSLFLDKNVSF